MAFHVAGVPILLGAAVLLFIPWAQRTGNVTNDALSVVGDFGQLSDFGDHASLGLLEEDPNIGGNDGNVLGAWAAPSVRRRGSSFRGSVNSIDSYSRRVSYEVSYKKNSPCVDIKGAVAIPVGQSRRCSDGGIGPFYPAEQTSLPGQHRLFPPASPTNAILPVRPSGRYRSISESSGVKVS